MRAPPQDSLPFVVDPGPANLTRTIHQLSRPTLWEEHQPDENTLSNAFPPAQPLEPMTHASLPDVAVTIRSLDPGFRVTPEGFVEYVLIARDRVTCPPGARSALGAHLVSNQIRFLVERVPPDA
ncbi:hypothetical protein GCM10026982_57810 [Nocardiopsis aegyptia]